MHESTFEYLKPTDDQMRAMATCRGAFKELALGLDALLPAGDDKDYALRLLRTSAMWVNIALTRDVDGAPRE